MRRSRRYSGQVVGAAPTARPDLFGLGVDRGIFSAVEQLVHPLFTHCLLRYVPSRVEGENPGRVVPSAANCSIGVLSKRLIAIAIVEEYFCAE